MTQKGRAWIELNMEHLAHNAAQLKKMLPKSCALMPAVKADAYGHGAVAVSRALQSMGIRDFCVASADEAIELRGAGIAGQILILGYTPPDQFPLLARYALTQTVIDVSYARLLEGYGHSLPVHVAIDTGMHRLGERSGNRESIYSLWKMKNLKITGLFSHLCAADGVSRRERAFTERQIAEFQSVVEDLHKKGIGGFKTHLQGSYGVLRYPELSFDYARVGLALYGVYESSRERSADLKPVLSLKTRIICVKPLYPGETAGYGLAYRAKKERKIAVAAIGYGDGIPRALSGRGYALVRGRRVPIIGRICMDQLLLDVSEISPVSPGDEAVLIGRDGNEEILASDIADQTGTISNEILSRLGKRPVRIVSPALTEIPSDIVPVSYR